MELSAAAEHALSMTHTNHVETSNSGAGKKNREKRKVREALAIKQLKKEDTRTEALT